MSKKPKLLVVTGGGDCPGLNAVIRAIVRRARLHYGWDVVGSEDAFNGILDDPRRLMTLDIETVKGILDRGGTILGTTNRGDPFSYPVRRPDGTVQLVDRSDELVAICKEEGVDCVVTIGGDGSARIAQRLFEKGLPVVSVPKTIDNDLSCTEYTFGYLSAVATACEAVDKLHTTGESHDRIMVLEVMGRDAGWIALACAVAGGAHQCLIPEIPYDLAKVASDIKATIRRENFKNSYAVVVVAEGARPKGGAVTASISKDPAYKMPRLGGVAVGVAEELERLTGIDTRYTVLGHVQRGGTPSAFDRILASEYGVFAVDMVAERKFGFMAAYQRERMVAVPIKEAIAVYKNVQPMSTLLQTARGLGIGFGD
jgi:ATP-dependent phosphofructokinase / diphosphate-dependent phosphofructokinase